MKRLTFAVTFLFTPFVLASASLDFHRQGDRIDAEASTCDEIRNVLPRLQNWMSEREPQRSCHPAYTRLTNHHCVADIAGCLPARVRDVFDRQQVIQTGDDIAGPNCFNLAMYSVGLTPALTNMSEDELRALLRPPLCHELTANESPRTGDVGLITQGQEAVHTYIYISPTVAWSKDGLGSNSTARLQPAAGMRRLYENHHGGECGENCENGNQNPFLTTYLRCQSLETFLHSSGGPIEPSLLQHVADLDQTSCTASSMFFQRGAMTAESVNGLNNSILALARYYHDEVARQPLQNPPTTKRDVLLTVTRLRLQSMQVSTQDMQRSLGDPHYLETQQQLNGLLSR